MMSCRRVAEIAAGDRQHELTRMQRVELRFHLLMCTHCRRYVKQISAIGQAMRRAFGRGDAPPRLEEKIVRACSGESPGASPEAPETS